MHGVKHTQSYLRYSTSMVEVITNSLEDTLIDGLSFKLAKTAPYIANRRSCTFHTQFCNIYRSVAVAKLIKITIAGKGLVRSINILYHA